MAISFGASATKSASLADRLLAATRRAARAAGRPLDSRLTRKIAPLSGFDILILIIIGFAAVNGLQRGFMLGMFDLVALGGAILVGARLAGWLAEPLRERGIPDPLAASAGFLFASVVCYAVIGLAIRILLSPLNAFGSGTALGWVNGVLGLIPGAIRGAALAAIVVLGLSAMPRELGVTGGLADSRFAQPLSVAGREALSAGLNWTGVDPSTLGLPNDFVASGTDRLPFSGVTEVDVDREAEDRLFTLLNQERAAAGLQPLEADTALAGVGRRHAREMFRLGFFSHVSPTSGGLEERLADAGLQTALFAENIALAPTADLAHEGLMNSPPYRANILNPGFTRVGISALHSDDHGLMVTENFGG